MHTDLARIGGFECSDERINRLHRVAEWSFRGNACDIPTDCPTRERSGWVGDWQIYIDTAAYLYDVGDFSAKWLRDLAADQLDRRRGHQHRPRPQPRRRPIWPNGHGAAGWGDAAVHVPWELYRTTGRTEVLADQFDSMRRWVDFAAARAATGRHPSRVEQRPDPLPHERYLWDSGWHFGEWLEPGDDMDDRLRPAARRRPRPRRHRLPLPLRRPARRASPTSSATDDATDHYGELAANVARRLAHRVHRRRRTRPAPTRRRTSCEPSRSASSPTHLRAAAAADLVALVRAAGTHLGTGFLATPFLLPVLADTATSTSPTSCCSRTPSRRGSPWSTARHDDLGGLGRRRRRRHRLPRRSTTTARARSSRSCTATSPASSCVEPGYRRFRVAPRPGGGITSARTHHDSPHGRIDVTLAARRRPRRHLDVTVPAGTQAELRLPDGTDDVLGPGAHQRRWAA